MKKYIPILTKTQLFAGLCEQETESMIGCLGAKLRKYKKGEYIFRQGDYINSICIPVEGSIHIQNDDYWGNRSIINVIFTGEIFGEAYAAPSGEALLVDVVAASDSVVLFFDICAVLTVCSTACRFHSKVVQNLFFAVSEKNRRLVQKLGHITKRSTREKLISYLSEEAKKHGGGKFTIPFNRQQLADFLSVDRSAMSNELCKMRDEGMLMFHKSDFVLYSFED